MAESKAVATISLVVSEDDFQVFVDTNQGWSPEMVQAVIDAANEAAKSWRANVISEDE